MVNRKAQSLGKTGMTTMTNRYFMMRHGESEANRQGIIVGAPENAINSFGLTNLGAEQVSRSALNTRLTYDTIIVSSDYKRAIETAQIVHSVLACEHQVIIDERLRERNFGIWELHDHRFYQQVWEHDVQYPARTKNSVESVVDTLARGLEVVRSLEQKYTDKTVLLVGHGDVLQILLAHHQHVNPRFHRNLSGLGNAEIRSLATLTSLSKSSA